MNVNLYLRNNKRSDIHGGEWSTQGGQQPHGCWDAPRMGISGLLAIGHDTGICDFLVPTVKRKGSETPLSFTAVRNQWTPAWMRTVYRSEPETDVYKKSGTVVLEETKCFLPNGVFVSRITLRNDLREPAELVISLRSPYVENGMFHGKTNAGALHAVFPIDLYAETLCTLDGCGEYAVTVPANGNVTLVYEATVNGFAPPAIDGAITNTATVSGDTLTNPVTAEETVTAAAAPLLSISKSLSPTDVAENGILTYTFVIQNTGNTAAEDAVLTDTFDPRLSNISVTVNGETLTPAEYTYDGATGLFTLGDISVPAASFTRDETTGAWVITPGVTVITVTGTV